MSTMDYKAIKSTKLSPLTKQGAPNQTTATRTMATSKVPELEKGQILKGEVIDLRDKDIKIMLPDGRMLSGSVNEAVNLSIGEQASFIVEEVTPATIVLKAMPKNQELTSDATIDKALEEANLPKTDRNVTIVRELLANQMSINKNSITTILRQAAAFRNASITTLILMNKFQIPVTETNTTQFEAYQNFEHRIVTQTSELLTSLMELNTLQPAGAPIKELNQLLLTMLTQTEATIPQNDAVPSPTEASLLMQDASLTKEASLLTQEASLLTPEASLLTSNASLLTSNASLLTNGTPQLPNETSLLASDAILLANDAASLTNVPLEEASMSHEASTLESNALGLSNTAEPDTTLIGSLLTPSERQDLLTNLLPFLSDPSKQIALLTGKFPIQELLARIKEANTFQGVEAKNMADSLTQLFKNTSYQKLIKTTLLQEFTLSPLDLLKKNSLSNFYEKLDHDFEVLEKFLAQAEMNSQGESQNNPHHQASSLRENIDFMKTLNQFFGYIQLPLNLTKDIVHSDLYVYTNKKQLQLGTDTVSVLLHLDMTHLGPLDAHLTLHKKHITAKLTLKEESSLTLLESNIHLLETALNEKEYSLTYQFAPQEKEIDLVQDFLKQENPDLIMKRYTFDKRA